MIWFFAGCSLLTLWLDRALFRRFLAPKGGVVRLVGGALLVATALIPFVVEICSKWIVEDNTPQLTRCWMWLIWIFLLIIPTRLILHVGWRTKSRALRGCAVGAVVLVVGGLLWGTAIERTRLRVVEEEIRSERLPSGWQGARVLLLSDLHLGTMLHPTKECRALVDRIERLNPDLILVAGDLVHIRYSELDSSLMQILGRLQAPLGVYSVMGNHDVGSYIRDTITLPAEQSCKLLQERQRAMGWEVLCNESRLLVRGGDTLQLTGLDFNPAWRELRHDRTLPAWPPLEEALQERDSSRFGIILCHLPQLWEEVLKRQGEDLTLSGHVHSMQHKLPLGQRGLSLARLKYPRWSGRYEEQGHTLYINDGIGSVGLPARLGAPPEITLFTLQDR